MYQRRLFKKMFIYVLECEHGKYYVGKTNNCTKRFAQHVRSQGAVWTRMHPPKRIVEVKEAFDGYEEDKITKMYMAKYGIDNVRGGSYTQPDLDDSTKQFITKEVITAHDLCYRCGGKGHFANECVQALKRPSKDHYILVFLLGGFVGVMMASWMT